MTSKKNILLLVLLVPHSLIKARGEGIALNIPFERLADKSSNMHPALSNLQDHVINRLNPNANVLVEPPVDPVGTPPSDVELPEESAKTPEPATDVELPEESAKTPEPATDVELPEESAKTPEPATGVELPEESAQTPAPATGVELPEESAKTPPPATDVNGGAGANASVDQLNQEPVNNRQNDSTEEPAQTPESAVGSALGSHLEQIEAATKARNVGKPNVTLERREPGLLNAISARVALLVDKMTHFIDEKRIQKATEALNEQAEIGGEPVPGKVAQEAVQSVDNATAAAQNLGEVAQEAAGALAQNLGEVAQKAVGALESVIENAKSTDVTRNPDGTFEVSSKENKKEDQSKNDDSEADALAKKEEEAANNNQAPTDGSKGSAATSESEEPKTEESAQKPKENSKEDKQPAKGSPSQGETESKGLFSSVGAYCTGVAVQASAAVTAHPVLAAAGGTAVVVAAVWVVYKLKYTRSRANTLEEDLKELERTI